MNYCEQYCQTIKRMANAGGGDSTWVFDPEAAWQDIVATCESNSGKTYTDSYTTFGEITGSNKWSGGVLADNGFIYSCRYSAPNILKLSYKDDSFSTVLGKGSEAIGGSLASNKTIYYSYGGSISSIKRLFTTLNTTNDEVGGFYPNLTGDSSTPAFIGSILAPNGYIYYIPSYSTVVIKINPLDNTDTIFGELPVGEKWCGGVLAPNGCIYGIPYKSTSILKIDPGSDVNTNFQTNTLLSPYLNTY